MSAAQHAYVYPALFWHQTSPNKCTADAIGLSESGEYSVRTTMGTIDPPAFVGEKTYTANYCEENIYRLAKTLTSLPDYDSTNDIIFVVFISNLSRTVALWQQRASPDPELPVVWDYHVILVRFQRNMSVSSADGARTAPTECWHGWVYDFDSRCGFISSWGEYVRETFLPHFSLDGRFRWQAEAPPSSKKVCLLTASSSMFRVISVNTFLEEFASDRTHMHVQSLGESAAEPSYISPPPTYPPIVGKRAAEKGVHNNLMDVFVSMESPEGVGSVLCDRDFFELEATLDLVSL
ncbi:hypothetical protein BOTBODRAFT_243436 [Botryobasidium botryosum FD-172 SS1]|uniref:Protein N-terminal glutamine amidohydrolase n=1 Tax=Botryobasidium botryosum (strain FD-172 SS1) TaxID=930990 RepID=A0A067LUE4_BOTB1|nr:hypothetical protein BOTBODRAFT_243436 [Botryobasidium botryosum FD-172 SS1]